MAVNPVALPGLNDANPVRQNTAIRQLSERLETDYAPLASPVFTGDPQAPTPSLADNDTSIATTAYVQGQNYTTKTYVDAANATQDTAIAGKAALVHTHAQSDVTGLVAALAGKEPTITGSGNATDYWGGDKAFHAIPSQVLVRTYYAGYTTNANLTTAIPTADSVPTSSQGTQILSQSVVVDNSTQRVRLRFSACFANSVATVITFAVFRGTTCVGARQAYASSSVGGSQIIVDVDETPGASGTYTYTVRCGPDSGTLALNGQVSARRLGGSSAATLCVDVVN